MLRNLTHSCHEPAARPGYLATALDAAVMRQLGAPSDERVNVGNTCEPSAPRAAAASAPNRWPRSNDPARLGSSAPTKRFRFHARHVSPSRSNSAQRHTHKTARRWAQQIVALPPGRFLEQGGSQSCAARQTARIAAKHHVAVSCPYTRVTSWAGVLTCDSVASAVIEGARPAAGAGQRAPERRSYGVGSGRSRRARCLRTSGKCIAHPDVTLPQYGVHSRQSVHMAAIRADSSSAALLPGRVSECTLLHASMRAANDADLTLVVATDKCCCGAGGDGAATEAARTLRVHRC